MAIKSTQIPDTQTGEGANAVHCYVDSLLSDPELAAQITCHRLMPKAPPEYGANRIPWSTAISNLLASRNIRLYSHQTLATDHIRAGHSIVAATPTASGKSLIYNLPVLEKFLKDPEARALYIFPLKALAQDQLQAFFSLCSTWPKDARPAAALYDGDTSDHNRRKIRNDPPTALITNPEMLHLGILPHHQNWTTFLANLNYVIVDEAHIYRGLFGTHMAQVFQRLNRICCQYGANPTYIFCTATLGNPDELAGQLMGSDAYSKPALVNKSGAPQGPRNFLFINPEQSSATCAIDLLKRALERKLRVIVYCHSRRMTELISLWAGSESGPWRNKISAYRAGFLADERRDIEARMASGELMAVVSTSALELGIDIGGLDVCILVGYPGTVMQTLQRGGRVGRSRRESAVLIVAGEDALDQYLVRNPAEFFSRCPEKAMINPDNEVILARHLECAAAELALSAGEPWLQTQSSRRALRDLERNGLLLRTPDGQEWVASRKNPQRHVNLRGSGSSYGIEDDSGNIIGMIDGFRAWKETHPGAVYIHHGQSYVIEKIDSGKMRIHAKAAKVGWFTRARALKTTDILEEHERLPIGRCLVARGRLRITERITSYEKRATSGNRLLTVSPLAAPPQIFETEGIWYVIPDNIRQDLENRFVHFMGSIHALEHAIIGLLPLEVMADRNDFGGISIPLHPQLGLPAVFIYDGLPGGAGLTRAAFHSARDLLAATLKGVAGCPCEDGCPSCVHSPKCGAGNRPLSKSGCIELLEALLAPGNEGERMATSLQLSPVQDMLLPVDANPETEAVTTPAVQPLAAAFMPSHAQASISDLPPLEPPHHYVVFDVETRRSAAEVGGWHKTAQMGVSVAVLYDSMADAYFTYEQDALPELFEKMAGADLVIGFNSVRFDYSVLEPFARQMPGYSTFDIKKLPTLDLLQRIYERLNYRISLDNLGQATLGSPKSADGLQALRWWKEGRIDEIAAYCRKDVELTRNLYLYGIKNHFLLFRNKAGKEARVNVDFAIRTS